MKARFFFAPFMQHQNGKSTWQKLYVLTEDGVLYSEYLDYMVPSKDIKNFNYETFKSNDYSFSGYQSLTEITYEVAKTKSLKSQANWIDSYINHKNINIGSQKENNIHTSETKHEIQKSSEVSNDELIQDFINNMVYVEGGTFTMGYTKPETLEINSDLIPHEVTLKSFKISKYLVTQDLFEFVTGYNNSTYKSSKAPITNLLFDEIIDFINELNSVTKLKFRLPSEAEWEYAARGGLKSNNYRYAGSESIRKVSYFKENSNDTIHDVGQKSPNELGIYDMSGLAWEYCQDGYYRYSSEAQISPIYEVNSHRKILRGGSYRSNSNHCAVYTRSSYLASSGNNTSVRLVI